LDGDDNVIMVWLENKLQIIIKIAKDKEQRLQRGLVLLTP